MTPAAIPGKCAIGNLVLNSFGLFCSLIPNIPYIFTTPSGLNLSSTLSTANQAVQSAIGRLIVNGAYVTASLGQEGEREERREKRPVRARREPEAARTSERPCQASESKRGKEGDKTLIKRRGWGEEGRCTREWWVGRGPVGRGNGL
jgi:hypothetical protein